MEAYQIEKVTAQQDFGMFFTFWGNVTFLKEANSGRLFSKYYIKSKDTPTAPSGWSFEPHTFTQAKKVILKKGETIDSVTDELGNVYYEVTYLIES